MAIGVSIEVGSSILFVRGDSLPDGAQGVAGIDSIFRALGDNVLAMEMSMDAEFEVYYTALVLRSNNTVEWVPLEEVNRPKLAAVS